MDLNIAICDDNRKDMQSLSDLLTVCSIQLDIELQTTCFSDLNSILNSIDPSTPLPYHVIFLDIEMPGGSGIDLARTLNRIIPTHTLIVFVSNYPEYMSESFSVHPFDFLQKPVKPDHLRRLLIDIQEKEAKRHRQTLIVTKSNEDVKLQAEEILYIQSTNSKSQDLIIYTLRETYQKRGTLIKLEKLYPDLLFSLNRSILVNLLYVHYLTERHVVLNNGIELPVSVRNRKNLIKILKNNPSIHL